MNRRRSATVLLLLALGAAFPSQGHDPSKHKGRQTKGEVLAVAGDRVELKTAAGTKVVTLNDKTKFERGDAAAAKADLKPGRQIIVIGTTLASGEIVAKEVLLDTGAPAKKPAGKR